MAKKTEKKISINTLKKAIKENPVREKRYMINIDEGVSPILCKLQNAM